MFPYWRQQHESRTLRTKHYDIAQASDHIQQDLQQNYLFRTSWCLMDNLPVDTIPITVQWPVIVSLTMRPPPLSPGHAVWWLWLRPAHNWSPWGLLEPGSAAHSSSDNSGTCVTSNCLDIGACSSTPVLPHPVTVAMWGTRVHVSRVRGRQMGTMCLTCLSSCSSATSWRGWVSTNPFNLVWISLVKFGWMLTLVTW